MLKNLYIIAGPNGAGKTTASYTLLPEILHCDEFINADEIARGLSPFKPEAAAFPAGRIMLERIQTLMESGKDFAFETTLATKSYKSLIVKAQAAGYFVKLIFFYLHSEDLAIERVKFRVKEGGHNIPEKVIRRRYKNGLQNFFHIFEPIVDDWFFVNSSGKPYESIAEKSNGILEVYNEKLWQKLKTI